MKKTFFFLKIYWAPCFYNTFSRTYSLELENSTYPWVKGKLLRKTTGVFLKEICRAPSFRAHGKHHLMKIHMFECLKLLAILRNFVTCCEKGSVPSKICKISALHTGFKTVFLQRLSFLLFLSNKEQYFISSDLIDLYEYHLF